MEQKIRQLSEEEEKAIREYAETASAAKNRVPAFRFGYRSGLEDMAERSVPLSAFLELREALETLQKSSNYIFASHQSRDHYSGYYEDLQAATAALSSTEKYNPIS